MTNEKPRPMTADDPAIRLREELAKLCHDQWSGWMQYVFSKLYPMGGKHKGGYRMRVIEAERWTRQMNTPYADLSDAEKDSDRAEADRFLALLASRDAQVGKLERMVEIEKRAYDRLALCPDHRDKANGTCIVCKAEHVTRQELHAEYREKLASRPTRNPDNSFTQDGVTYLCTCGFKWTLPGTSEAK
jgi:hypothetical protein